MKYSQFIQLQPLLEENINSDKEKLNEVVGLLALGGLAASGIGFLFRKHILSWGVKQVYIQQLNRIGEKFKDDINKTIETSIKTYQDKVKKIKNSDDIDQNRQLLNLQTNVLNIINKAVDNLTNLKTKEIYERIEKSKKMKESAKIALKYYWETLITDIKVGALTDLVSKNIITNKVLKDKINKTIKVKEKDLKDKEQNVKTNIRNIQTEEKQYKTKDYYEKQINKEVEKQNIESDENTKEEILHKIVTLLDKANKNLVSDEYNQLINEIPDIEGLEKNQIRSEEGLRDVKLIY